MPIDAMRMGELRGKFAKLDKNGDRKLNYDEMSKLLRRGNPGMDDRELKMIYDNVDKNHDGLIDFDEFADFLLSKTGETRTSAVPSGLKGPERFYYDKSSYTGVHTAGGPSTVDSGGDLRDQVRGGHHTGSTSMRGGVSDNVRQHVEMPLMQTAPPGGDPDQPRQPRPPTTENPGGPRGPERFYYDKSSYTGVATHGGPSTIDNGGDLREQVRGGMHSGGTAMKSTDVVLKEPERPLMQTEPPGGAVRHREPRQF